MLDNQTGILLAEYQDIVKSQQLDRGILYSTNVIA
jgi:hypothetical protein